MWVKEKGLIVYAWVIMSNHVHLLMSTKEKPCEDILRDLKKFTSKAIIKAIEENSQESRKGWLLWMFERAGQKNSNNNRYQFWQQNNQPRELSNNPQEIDNVVNYIHENPIKAGFVNKAGEYPYSSAVDYADGKGMIEIYKT